MKNIETAFQHVKMFTAVLVVCCFLLCGFVLFKSYQLAAIIQSKVYVLANGKVYTPMKLTMSGRSKLTTYFSVEEERFKYDSVVNNLS